MKNIYKLLLTLSLLVAVSYKSISQTYCIPDYSFAPFGCSDINGGDVIDDFFTTGGITNITNMNTGCNADYTYWSGLTASQIAGSNITLNMQAGPTFAEWFRVWIDYNNDGNFNGLSEDVYASATNTTLLLTQQITIPIGTTPGLKRMRVMCKYGGVQMLNTDYCSTAFTFGECEDYNLMVLPLAAYDPAVYFISQPTGNCFTANQQFQVRIKNYGSQPIVLGPGPTDNKIQVLLNVNGPGGLAVYDTTLTSGTLSALGADSIVAFFLSAFQNSLNLYNGGTYSINSAINSINFINGSLLDDSLPNPIVLVNYRPTQGPTYDLCQGSSVPFGQGLTVSGCATSLSDSVTITFNVTPCMDNVGATGTGTSTGAPANCANVFACPFANGILPALPPGAFFTQPSVLSVTNLSSTFPTELRFNVYGAVPDGPSLYSGCPTPYNVGANDINVGGVSAQPWTPSFTHRRNIPPASISAMYSNLVPGNTVNIGYFELWNDLPSASDLNANVGGATQVTLKIYYKYIPPSFEWYDTPVGGTSLDSLSPFNPLMVTNSLVNSSNVPGTFVFYAACTGSSNCRIADTFRIKPSPLVFQDSIITCENISSSNTATVDLTTLDNSVTGGLAVDSVDYFYDMANFSPVIPPNADTTGSIILYSKVYLGQCSSSDTVLVQVNSTPELALTSNSPIICSPNIGNVLDYINPFSFSPLGTDTFYYQDAACTQVYTNPYILNTTDSIYIVLATGNPVCADTLGLFVDVSSSSNLIVNQSNLNISNCSLTDPIPTAFKNFNDGQTQDVFNSIDCRKIVGVTDLPNGMSLGNTAVTETIDCPNPIYNTVPYLNRHFEIVPSNQDSARVCLYFLEDDIASFNFDANIGGYQTFNVPTLSNLCIHKIDNGAITDPNMVLTVIDSSVITVTYDPVYSVYTACFDVANFSSFYCATCQPVTGPLPVNWSSFSAKRKENTAVLNWITAQEANNDYFIVERGKDGKNFNLLSNPITSKAINGNSGTPLSYAYIDESPMEGYNYYRIRQQDKDGKWNYSIVKQVYFGNETIVQVYPNPVQEELNIDISIARATTAVMQLTDATGRIVRRMQASLNVGSNSVELNMKELAQGIYLLKISNDKGLQHIQQIQKN